MPVDPRLYAPTTGLLEGRIILVTGAGAGIGAEAARTLAHFGATVVLVGRTQKKLEAVYDAIEAEGGPQTVIFVIDFAKARRED